MNWKDFTETLQSEFGFKPKTALIVSALALSVIYVQFFKIPSIETTSRRILNKTLDAITALDSKCTPRLPSGGFPGTDQKPEQYQMNMEIKEINDLKELRDEISRSDDHDGSPRAPTSYKGEVQKK
jgi:hypothetical protein